MPDLLAEFATHLARLLGHKEHSYSRGMVTISAPGTARPTCAKGPRRRTGTPDHQALSSGSHGTGVEAKLTGSPDPKLRGLRRSQRCPHPRGHLTSERGSSHLRPPITARARAGRGRDHALRVCNRATSARESVPESHAMPPVAVRERVCARDTSKSQPAASRHLATPSSCASAGT